MTHMETSVSKFYAGKNVFLTGATGFVGKVLLEKLLYACSDVKCVYILVREKKGVPGSVRIEQLIKSPVFSGPNRIPHNVLKTKVIPVYGDLSFPGLGLSAEHKSLVISEVDIILHCAASVRFDDPVKEALQTNFLGTKSIADLCHSMEKLEAFVHVSTCYSNCHFDEVEEKVYKTRITGDRLLEMADWMGDRLDKFAVENLYEGRPNSYTFTKALAESYVNEHCKGLPVAIARLPIVIPAMKDPEPGFIDIASAGNFVVLVQGLGAIRTFDYEPKSVLNLMPVDSTANAILLAARDVAVNRQNEVKVFNMALGPEFDIPLQHYLEVNDSLFKDFVSFKTFRKPISTISTKPTKFEFIYKKYILELFYAVLFDFFLLISGRKSFALNKMLFVANVRDALNPFGKRKFRFCNDNFVQLCSSQETADKILFNANPEDVAHMLSSKKSYLEFVRSGCIAYMKYKLDDQYTPESQPARERHMMKLRYREIVMGFAIHAMLLLFAYAVYYAFNFSFTALHGLKAV